MAEEPSKSGFNLPWANIVALLVAGGGLLTLIPSLRTSRPPDPGGASMPVFGDQTVDSRLWQDPFEEVMKDKEGKAGKGAYNGRIRKRDGAGKRKRGPGVDRHGDERTER